MKQVTTVTAIFLLWGMIPLPALAQLCNTEEVHDESSVLVTLYFLPETKACRPNGYGGSNTCETWQVDEFIGFAEQERYLPVCSKLPPEEISLAHLAEAVRRYSNRCSPESVDPTCTEASNRWSVMLLIDASPTNNKSLTINFSRGRSDSSEGHPYAISGELPKSGRWLNHQRADAFLPKKEIQWTLKIGKITRTFKTKD